MAGQPSIEPTPITSAAATAPETGAMIQGETGRDGGASTGDTDGASGQGSCGCSCGGSGEGSDGVSDDASAALDSAGLLVSLDTSVASRSMVGGSRFGRP